MGAYQVNKKSHKLQLETKLNVAIHKKKISLIEIKFSKQFFR